MSIRLQAYSVILVYPDCVLPGQFEPERYSAPSFDFQSFCCIDSSRIYMWLLGGVLVIINSDKNNPFFQFPTILNLFP